MPSPPCSLEKGNNSLEHEPSAGKGRVVGWRRYVPSRWRDMPFLYALLLGPGAILLGMDGLLYALGIEIPGYQADLEATLGGKLGLGFLSVLWLAEGTLLLLRHPTALWVFYAVLAFSSLPHIWLLPGGVPEFVAAVAIPLIFGLWAWAHRGWFDIDWRHQEATRADS